MDALDDVRDLRLDDGLEGVRRRGEDPRPEVAGAGQVDLAAAGTERVDQLLWHPGRDELRRDLGLDPVREQRAGDRQADRSSDLLEERQAACRHADPVGRHGVLDDQGEHRERRPDPEPGQGHPQPEDGAVRFGPEVGHEEQRQAEQQQRPEHQVLVAADAGHDLAGRDRAEDEPGEQREDVVARFGCAGAGDCLEPARQEDDPGEEPEACEEHRGHGDREGPQAEQVERHDRIGGP